MEIQNPKMSRTDMWLKTGIKSFIIHHVPYNKVHRRRQLDSWRSHSQGILEHLFCRDRSLLVLVFGDRINFDQIFIGGIIWTKDA